MAYSALPSKTSSDTLDLADYNKIKGNFEAGVPDIFTTKGDLAAGTAADAADRLAVGANNSILIAKSGETTGLYWQPVHGARVYNSGNIDPATSTWVTLTFDSERFDPDGMHSTSSNTERLTIIGAGTGLYMVGGTVTFDTSGTGTGGSIKGVRIRYTTSGPTTVTIAEHIIGSIHGFFDITLSICTMYDAPTTGDYFDMQVYTNTDVDVVAVGNYSPVFWAMWQGMHK